MYISVVDLSTGEEEHHNTRIHSDHALLEYLCLKGAGNEVQGEKGRERGGGRESRERRAPVGLRQLLKRRNGR